MFAAKCLLLIAPVCDTSVVFPRHEQFCGDVFGQARWTKENPPRFWSVLAQRAKVAAVAKQLKIVQDVNRPATERIAAIETLVALKDSSVRAKLLAAMGNQFDIVDHYIIWALGQLGDAQTLKALESILENPKLRLTSQISTVLIGAIRHLKRRLPRNVGG